MRATISSVLKRTQYCPVLRPTPGRNDIIRIHNASNFYKLPQRLPMMSSGQGAHIPMNSQDHQGMRPIRRQELVTPIRMFPRYPQLPLLKAKGRCMDPAAAVVAKVPPCLGILEPEVAILLDTEPVSSQKSRISEVPQLDLIFNERDGPAALLFDDMICIARPRNSPVVAPKTFRAFSWGWTLEAFGRGRTLHGFGWGRRRVYPTSAARSIAHCVELGILLLRVGGHIDLR